MSSRALATPSRSNVLVDALPGEQIRDLLTVAGYALLVGLTAQVVILLPFTPVPITGQTFGVLMGAMAIGLRRATLGMALYVLAGLAGLPWFAQGQGGTASVVLPSFGYIVGFLIASPLLGWLAEAGWGKDPFRVLAAMAGGSLVIYAVGAAWLALALSIGPQEAIRLGVLPFVLGDLLKALAACALLPTASRLIGLR